MFVDSHAHLDDERFTPDLDAVISRARQAGVKRIVSVGVGLASTEHAVRLARSYEGVVFATAGVHPHDAKTFGKSERESLRALTCGPGVVAVGETGLDYHYENSPRDAQQAAFEFHLELALAVGRPVIVHCREAFADCLRILRRYSGRGLRGVAHCFSGSWAEAHEFLDMGFYVSFAGTLTFKKAHALRAVAAGVPMERVLIETDCPYLAPQPRRGRRNEPAFVPFVAEALGRVHGRPTEEVGRVTAENARCLYAWDET